MKLQEFLMKNGVQTEVQTEVHIKPFPEPFIIKSITEAENKAIRKSCEKTEFNKKTRQKETVMDRDLYANRLVVACCVDPNFKDAEFQKKFGVVGAEKLLDKILTPGQFAELFEKVQELLGFDTDINDLIEEAKN